MLKSIVFNLALSALLVIVLTSINTQRIDKVRREHDLAIAEIEKFNGLILSDLEEKTKIDELVVQWINNITSLMEEVPHATSN